VSFRKSIRRRKEILAKAESVAICALQECGRFFAKRTLYLVFLLSISTTYAMAQAGGGQSSQPCTSTVVGDLRIEHFDSKVLGGPQTLRIWLPPGYSDAVNAQRSYPVLYAFDGQSYFDRCTSPFGSEVQMDEILTRLIGEGKVEPIIVVGIDSPVEASRAASPHPSLEMKARSSMLVEDPDNLATTMYRFDFEPHGQRLAPFFTTELMPQIEREFRIKKGRAFTAIGGFSYGGVAAVNLLVELPMVFGIGWIESPSASPANGALARRTQYLAVAPLRAYVGVGDRETMKSHKTMSDMGLDPGTFDRNFAQGARVIADNFKAAGGADSQVLFVEEPQADHSEASWARRFPAAIAFLFPVQK
jgi:enterochelin esterase-like enzyme